jgi:hypothetical protein
VNRENATARAIRHVRWVWQLIEWQRELRALPGLVERRRNRVRAA